MYIYYVDCNNRRYKHKSYKSAIKQYQLLKRKGFKVTIKIYDSFTNMLVKY